MIQTVIFYSTIKDFTCLSQKKEKKKTLPVDI